MSKNKITFPEPKGVKCNMMPFIQGDSSSLPEKYKSYSEIVDSNFLEKGEIGFLTIDESYVEGGESQRGYNAKGIDRNVHIEVGRVESKTRWGGGGSSWGNKENTLLEDNTKVLIANSVSNTCRYWDTTEKRYTSDGCLGDYIEDYPVETGKIMRAGEVVKMSIFTPHECITQEVSSDRQFFRIVGKGVTGREPHFTKNELVKWN